MINNKHLQISKGRLLMRKRTLIHWFVFIVSLWSFLMNITFILPNPLGYIKYFPEAVILLLLLMNLRSCCFIIQRKVLLPICIVGALFLCTLILYLFRYQSIAYYLWGFRNNFRFYIAFFAFVFLLDENDVKTWFKLLDVLFWVNLLLTLFQFFFLGVRRDDLGGIFGIRGATNGYTIMLLCIALARSFLMSFQKNEKFILCILKSIASLTIAVLAELKAFFFLFIFVLIIAAMITRFSWRKCVVFIFGGVLLTIGVTKLTELYGFDGFFSWESLWDYATKKNYSSTNDINRLSAISVLSHKLELTPLDQIFGLGLGNCDTSSFAVCNTPFYRRYEYLHYTWLSVAMVFLEMGYLGLVLYIGFFVVCGWYAFKMYRMGIGNKINNQMAFLMAIVSLILMFYNSSLRMESGYMIYFILALPFMRGESSIDSMETI